MFGSNISIRFEANVDAQEELIGVSYQDKSIQLINKKSLSVVQGLYSIFHSNF
jgi:hypothetical protein